MVYFLKIFTLPYFYDTGEDFQVHAFNDIERVVKGVVALCTDDQSICCWYPLKLLYKALFADTKEVNAVLVDAVDASVHKKWIARIKQRLH